MKVNQFLLELLFSNEFFLTFIILTNSKHLQFGPYKILDRLSDVTNELLSQDGSTLHVHRSHLITYYPKEPLLYTHLRNFMRFASQIPPNLTTQNQLNLQMVTPPHLIPMNLYTTKIHHKNLLYHQLHPITILKPLPQVTARISNMTTHISKR